MLLLKVELLTHAWILMHSNTHSVKKTYTTLVCNVWILKLQTDYSDNAYSSKLGQQALWQLYWHYAASTATLLCHAMFDSSAYIYIVRQLLRDNMDVGIWLNGSLQISYSGLMKKKKSIVLSNRGTAGYDKHFQQISSSLKCVVTVLKISIWKYAHLGNISAKGAVVCCSTRCSKGVIS